MNTTENICPFCKMGQKFYISKNSIWQCNTCSMKGMDGYNLNMPTSKSIKEMDLYSRLRINWPTQNCKILLYNDHLQQTMRPVNYIRSKDDANTFLITYQLDHNILYVPDSQLKIKITSNDNKLVGTVSSKLSMSATNNNDFSTKVFNNAFPFKLFSYYISHNTDNLSLFFKSDGFDLNTHDYQSLMNNFKLNITTPALVNYEDIAKSNGSNPYVDHVILGMFVNDKPGPLVVAFNKSSYNKHDKKVAEVCRRTTLSVRTNQEKAFISWRALFNFPLKVQI